MQLHFRRPPVMYCLLKASWDTVFKETPLDKITQGGSKSDKNTMHMITGPKHIAPRVWMLRTRNFLKSYESTWISHIMSGYLNQGLGILCGWFNVFCLIKFSREQWAILKQTDLNRCLTWSEAIMKLKPAKVEFAWPFFALKARLL